LGALRGFLRGATMTGYGNPTKVSKTESCPAGGTLTLTLTVPYAMVLDYLDLQTSSALCYITSAKVNSLPYYDVQGAAMPLPGPPVDPAASAGYLARPLLAANTPITVSFKNDDAVPVTCAAIANGYLYGLVG